MALKHSLLLAAAIALAPAAALAQEGTAKPTDQKPAAVPAAAPIEVTVPLVGLTPENSAKAEEALEGLSTKVYVCTPCHVTESKAGNCPHCKGPLASKEVKPVTNASASAERGTLAFRVEGGTRVALTQVEGALQRSALRVDRDKFQVRGPVVLAVAGAKDAEAVEKVLKDAKLFPSVEADLDQVTGQVHVRVQSGSSSATLAAVAAVLEHQPHGWKLADVVWGAVPERAS